MAYAQLSYDPWETAPEERRARLVGRDPLLEQILTAVAQQPDDKTIQHYLLLGPRGIGKTTLLLTLRERIQQDAALSAKWFCVQLREEEYFIRTLRDLLELTLNGLADDEELPDAKEAERQVREEKREDRSLAAAVDGLRALASRHGKRILLLIDNFDRVFPATASGRGKKRTPENEFRAFRKLLSTENFLMVVGTSVRLFQEIATYDRAFFNFFLPVEVPELSDDKICDLLRRCAEAEENTGFLKQFDAIRDKVRAITFMTGGNPRLVLMLYDVLRQSEMAPVVQALRETVGGLTPLLKHVMDDMPRQQSKTLDALVRLRGAAAPNRIADMARLPLNVVTAQLGRLKDSRFVVADGEGKGRPATYRVSDPMFQTWYQMRYIKPAGRRVELFVEFIRAWFSVEERRQFLEEQWNKLGQRPGALQELSLVVQHYAGALDDEKERAGHFERLADVLAETGSDPEAAMLLAECFDLPGITVERYESEGYRHLGQRRLEKGDPAGAITTCRKALERDPGNVDGMLSLGACLYLTRDYVSAEGEFARVINSCGTTENQKASAFFNRGNVRGALGDFLGQIADYTALLDLHEVPAGMATPARFLRGIARRKLGDHLGEISDYTPLIDQPGAPALVVSLALLHRASARTHIGELGGACADYTAVVELPGAMPVHVAGALFERGRTREGLGDARGALADYTAMIDRHDGPIGLTGYALANRGRILLNAGDQVGFLRDIQAIVDLPPGVPPEPRAFALLIAGHACAEAGQVMEALGLWQEAMELRANRELVYAAFTELVAAHLRNKRAEEAVRGMSRLSEFELPETPIEQRLEARINAITSAARISGTEVAELLLKAAIEAGPEDIRSRLEFLTPAIQFAKTGDEQTLANLPERERELARQIAATFERVELPETLSKSSLTALII